MALSKQSPNARAEGKITWHGVEGGVGGVGGGGE